MHLSIVKAKMLWWNHIRSHEVSLKRQITICKFKTLNHMELY